MQGFRIQTSTMIQPNQVVIMADFDHPEIHIFEGVVPDGRIIYCNPVDEQRIRDAIAVEQERPQWWRTLQQAERLMEILRRRAG